MFSLHIKLAIRHFFKNSYFSLINLMSLVVGITTAALLINYVAHEKSYDLHHAHGDNIYRVESQFFQDSVMTDDWATSSFGYGSAMANDINGISSMSRVAVHQPEQVVTLEDIHIRENTIAYTESSYFTMFSNTLIDGDVKNVLDQPNSVAISVSAARKFFGSEDVVGKSLKFSTPDQTIRLQISGVFEDMPQSSHARYDYLISYATLPDWIREFWYIHEVYTYVSLEEGTTPRQIEAAFPEMAEKYKTLDALRDKTWAVELTPIADIHLNPLKQYEKETKGNRQTVNALWTMALIILIISWINYINLSSIKSSERTQEMAVRKVHGADKNQIAVQMIYEAGFMTIVALALSVIIIFFSQPLLSEWLGHAVELKLFTQTVYWLIPAIVILAGSLISALYPAFVLTRIHSITALKGGRIATGKSVLRKALVVLQFAGALLLVMATGAISGQISFMQEQSLGVSVDQQMAIKLPVNTPNLPEKLQVFEKELENMSQVSQVSIAGAVPGQEVATFASNKLKGSSENMLFEMLAVDEDYIPAMDLQIIAGRAFDKSFGDESHKLIVNESTLDKLGIDSPESAIGMEIMVETKDEPYEIVGVLANWHQRSLNNPYTPIMLIKNGSVGWIPPRLIVVAFDGNDYESVQKTIEKEWQVRFPQSSFDHFFVNDFYDQQYAADQQANQVIGFFTILAIFISYLGLWAFTSYLILTRMKEVSIRRVLGAKWWDVTRTFAKAIMPQITVGVLIALPVGLWAINEWLSNFAFQIPVGWAMIATPIVVVTALAFATIGIESIKPMSKNPATILRQD